MKRLLGTALVICGLLLGLVPTTALAAVGLTISTPYPAVTVDPGGTATFDLTITTTVAERVDIAVNSTLGEGWTTRLTGGGSTISAVFTSTTTTDASPAPAAAPTATATLEVSVPLDVQAGTYNVALEGTSAAGVTETLSLEMTVEQLGTGSVEMTTQNPVQRIRAGSSGTFDVGLRNDTNQEISFSLNVEGPLDWDLTAVPSGSTTAATFLVAAGSSTRITVTADTPEETEAGQYILTLSALGGPEPATIELGVEITGNYALNLTTSDGRLNSRVTVGADSKLSLAVQNSGSADLTGVTFSATPPSGWTVTFSPETVNLAAGADAQTVEATIHASEQAVAGDYSIDIRANFTSEGASANDSIEIRTTVETSPIWGFVGIAIIVLVIAGLFLVFRQYGRR